MTNARTQVVSLGFTGCENDAHSAQNGVYTAYLHGLTSYRFQQVTSPPNVFDDDSIVLYDKSVIQQLSKNLLPEQKVTAQKMFEQICQSEIHAIAQKGVALAKSIGIGDGQKVSATCIYGSGSTVVPVRVEFRTVD